MVGHVLALVRSLLDLSSARPASGLADRLHTVTFKSSLNCLIARWTSTRTLPSLWPAIWKSADRKTLAPQIDGLALAGRQLGHLPGQLAAEVLPLGQFGRVGLAADKHGQLGLAVAGVPLPQADQIHGLVAANAKQPGGLAAARNPPADRSQSCKKACCTASRAESPSPKSRPA